MCSKRFEKLFPSSIFQSFLPILHFSACSFQLLVLVPRLAKTSSNSLRSYDCCWSWYLWPPYTSRWGFTTGWLGYIHWFAFMRSNDMNGIFAGFSSCLGVLFVRIDVGFDKNTSCICGALSQWRVLSWLLSDSVNATFFCFAVVTGCLSISSLTMPLISWTDSSNIGLGLCSFWKNVFWPSANILSFSVLGNKVWVLWTMFCAMECSLFSFFLFWVSSCFTCFATSFYLEDRPPPSLVEQSLLQSDFASTLYCQKKSEIEYELEFSWKLHRSR